MDTALQPGLRFGQIYLSEAQFSHREDAVTLPTNSLSDELPLRVQARFFGQPGGTSAALAVRVFSPDDPALLYRISVEITAIVEVVAGRENMDPLEYVKTIGPVALFPFLREAVANLTLRGRFGAIFMKPFNLTAAESKPLEIEEEVPAFSSQADSGVERMLPKSKTKGGVGKKRRRRKRRPTDRPA